MKEKHLFLPFLLAVLAFIFERQALPFISFFIPFLAVILIRKSETFSLFSALGIGLYLDFLSFDVPFGFVCFTYFFAALFLLPLRRLFLEEGSFSLAAISYLLSFFIKVLSVFLLKIMKPVTLFSFSSLAKELLLIPLFDALYALIWFTTPLAIYYILKRKARHLLIYWKFRANKA